MSSLLNLDGFKLCYVVQLIETRVDVIRNRDELKQDTGDSVHLSQDIPVTLSLALDQLADPVLSCLFFAILMPVPQSPLLKSHFLRHWNRRKLGGGHMPPNILQFIRKSALFVAGSSVNEYS